MIFQSSRAVSPVFAPPSERSVQSVRSVNRGSCSLSGITAENSSFQRVISGEDEIFVQQGDLAETGFPQAAELEFQRGRRIAVGNGLHDAFRLGIAQRFP